jgi:hypothetical protein
MIATLKLDVRLRVSRVTHELMQPARVTKLTYLPLQPQRANAVGRLNSDAVRLIAPLSSETHGCACFQGRQRRIVCSNCHSLVHKCTCCSLPEHSKSSSATDESITVLPYVVACYRSGRSGVCAIFVHQSCTRPNGSWMSQARPPYRLQHCTHAAMLPSNTSQ